MILTQSVEETKKNFMKWWRGEDFGRPLINLMSSPKKPPKQGETRTQSDILDAERAYSRAKARYEATTLYGDTLPFSGLSVGVGGMPIFLGCEPVFAESTTWVKPMVDEGIGISSLGKLTYDENNRWWKEYLFQLTRLAELCREDGIFLTVPDILENLDVLGLLCGSQNMCYYLMDEPELVKEYVHQTDDLYFEYYERIYDIIKGRDGDSSCIFNIWSEKRTLKVQSDVSVFLSSTQFRELVIPSLEKQLSKIDYSLYHLDGPDAIRHLDDVLSLERLTALQFTPGDGNPSPEKEEWYPIYDKVRKAGKSLWVFLTGDDPINDSRKLVNRYGTAGLYLLYQNKDEELAKRIFEEADKGFR